MNKVLEIIKEQLEITHAKLSDKNIVDKSYLITLKKDLEETCYLIEISEKFNIKRKNVLEIFSLPILEDNFAEYRIIDDKESENRELWKELDKNKRLYPNDIIIKLQ